MDRAIIMIEAFLDALAYTVTPYDLMTFHCFVWAMMAMIILRIFDRVDLFRFLPLRSLR